MPQDVKLLRVFIGSPGGLEAERRLFAARIAQYNLAHGVHDGVLFWPVGWEDTLPGPRRPQALINEDLRKCDHAVFLLHNRWGSPSTTDPDSKVGTEEEWDIAQEMYGTRDLLNLLLFFKAVDAAQVNDPGAQLQKVLAFKKKIEDAKTHLFKHFSELNEFAAELDKILAAWGRPHRAGYGGLVGASVGEVVSALSAPAPSFDFWINEYLRLAERGTAAFDPRGALFCAEQAQLVAKPDLEWARAEHGKGFANSELGNPQEALASFDRVFERLSGSSDPAHRERVARALFNKGVTLGGLGRSEEELGVYDDVVARYGAAPEPGLREGVAGALVNKGARLGGLGRGEEALRVYDDVVARYGAAPEPGLREQVARALVGKGVGLRNLKRSAEGDIVLTDFFARFGAASEPEIVKLVELARPLVSKSRKPS